MRHLKYVGVSKILEEVTHVFQLLITIVSVPNDENFRRRQEVRCPFLVRVKLHLLASGHRQTDDGETKSRHSRTLLADRFVETWPGFLGVSKVEQILASFGRS